ncbi:MULTISPECIES: isochorismatase family protein [Auritidibacter]|uniref:Isochorismatase family protein n=1 Tax=Auritidibacter ignavus TaxID=678932 RepID=A0AAJ6AHS2_9MICC|nr:MULTISPECIES: isochorismatase family protein [Auritidibacter]AXR74280.1 isochorismatase family protein [Auritidibacter sp. NML130574]PXA82333.1 cysteine hydrolase [Auritidibacter sp. NML120779]WGH92267.1 isochorismatase family protein [Auritidibacter ignavus]
MARTTLRQLNGFDDTPAALADSTLIMVDFQNTYTTGVMELDGWEPALDAAADLLAKAREAGATVIHIVNDGGDGTPYDIHAEIGQIHPKVAPVEGEAVVAKTAPNAYVGTNLADLVDAAGHDDVVIAGFMTNMCVTFTAEGTFLHGKKPTVVAEACATRPLQTSIAEVPAEQLHHSALATIADLYGVVVPNTGSLR